MASPTIYKWTDTGAPQMKRGQIGDIQAIFQACLIDGYGSKTPPVSGTNKWSIPFSDASSFILKQGGTAARKCGIKLSGIYSDGRYMQVVAAEDWTDLNTPVKVWTTQHSYERVAAGYSNYASYNIPWCIVATERAIFVQFGYNTLQVDTALFDTNGSLNTYNGHWFFGDYVPEDPSITVNQMLCYTYYSSTQQQHYCQNFTYANSIRTGTGAKVLAGNAANITGMNACEVLCLRPGVSNSGTMGGYYTARHDPYYPNQINGGLYLDKYRIVSNNTVMGEIPGLLYSIQSRPFPANGTLMTIAGSGDYLGEDLYVFTDYNAAAYFIRSGDWGVE